MTLRKEKWDNSLIIGSDFQYTAELRAYNDTGFDIYEFKHNIKAALKVKQFNTVFPIEFTAIETGA